MRRLRRPTAPTGNTRVVVPTRWGRVIARSLLNVLNTPGSRWQDAFRGNSNAEKAVWAGHPVGFDLLTHGDGQFIAFYDAERKMTVGQRGLDEDAWVTL